MAMGPRSVNPQLLPRDRVLAQRATGKLVQWKGPFGWIIPDQKIDHPEAIKHRGKIYLGQEDVEQEIEGVGSRVSFFVYTDGSGLGAEHCIPARGYPPVQRTIDKTKATTAKATKDQRAPWRKSLDDEVEDGTTKNPDDEVEDGVKKPHPPPDKSNRETLNAAPLEGTVVDWKGQVGWIKPDEGSEIPEETKRTRKGKFFCHEIDVDGEMPLIGARVAFFVYNDGVGSGAEMVQILEQGTGERKPAKENTEEDAGFLGEDDGGPASGVKKVRKRNNKGKGGKAGPTARKEVGPSGPELARERVSELPMTGEVVSWRGKVGWIKPTEEIDHPDAEKHGGKVYTHKQDLLGVESLEKGAQVQFYLFSDASGLGAEECMPL